MKIPLIIPPDDVEEIKTGQYPLEILNKPISYDKPKDIIILNEENAVKDESISLNESPIDNLENSILVENDVQESQDIFDITYSISSFAKQATKNVNSTEVSLGKYSQDGVSYTKVAQQRGATYLQLDNWDNLVKEVGEKNIWNINESFIRQQASVNKTFILSHDPAQATGYFANEVNLLKGMGYRFIQEGSVWRAVK